MRVRRAVAALAAITAIGTGAVQAQPGAPRANLPEPGKPLALNAAGERVNVVLVAGGLVAPWSIAFLPDGALLVTESRGALRVVRNGELSAAPAYQLPDPPGNDALHGLAVHPDFARNQLVYLSYLKRTDRGVTLAVSRGKLENDRLNGVEEIFVADAFESQLNGSAGRLTFGPDRMLWFTVGDRDRLCCGATDDNSIRILAQDLSNHIGKILRLTDEGKPAPGNPFIGREGARPEIYSYGHRNGYDFAWHPETGELWEIEIGPMGGDEINIIKPGANYGWPLVSTGRNYSGTLVSEQPWHREGMEQPRMFWVPQISPSSLTFYTGDKFPSWQGSLFVGALSGMQVQRVQFELSGQAERRTPMLTELGVRFRDIEQGPDGYLYFATEVRYGSSNPDGTVIRLEPAEPAQPSGVRQR